MSDSREQLASAERLMQLALFLSTGLDELSRKKVVYWTLATHALPHVQTFPLLVLVGKMGTGKSETLKIIRRFAHRPKPLSLRGMTLATIRDGLAECQNGTAIIEEADSAWKDGEIFEQLLSDRYQSSSAKAAHKVSVGKDWETVIKAYFGATVLHRRIPFNDAALDGRSVVVRFRADNSRTYQEYSDDDPWTVEGAETLRGLIFDVPTVGKPPGVAARVFNTYRLLLGVASLCGDHDFLAQVHSVLLLETAELNEAQSAEPDGLVARAIVELVFTNGRGNFRNIRFSDLADAVRRSTGLQLQPRQVGRMARELGFETKTSHGVTVVVPTPVVLIKACDECGYEDEVIEDLRKQLLSGAKWPR
jgi:hypothetical protein